MSDIIRFYTKNRGKKPLAPESQYSDMDTISEPQRMLMRPPVPGGELFDGFLRRGEKRADGGPYLIPSPGHHEEDPDYPTDDPTVPPKHRRT